MRRPRDWTVTRPGDLVELDTLHGRPLPGRIWKQFTARDVVSRWDVVELSRLPTARAAVEVLDRLAERMPFAVRAISVDNGAEFMAASGLPGAAHPSLRAAAALTQAAQREAATRADR